MIFNRITTEKQNQYINYIQNITKKLSWGIFNWNKITSLIIKSNKVIRRQKKNKNIHVLCSESEEKNFFGISWSLKVIFFS